MLDLALVLVLAACGGDGPTGPDSADGTSPSSPSSVEPPGRVADLSTTASTDSSVTVSFTEVDDGTGRPAEYEVRFDTGDFSWTAAAEVTRGSCSSPVEGAEIGTTLTCTVQGLSAGTRYELALAAFRRDSTGPTYGEPSNLAAGETESSPDTASGDGSDDGSSDDGSGTTAPDGPTPDQLEDFSSYADIDHFLEDPNGWYLGRKNTQRMALDRSVTVTGAEQSLRYDFPENHDCSNYTITNELDIQPDTRELWLEVWVRFSANWHTTLSGCPDQAYDYKMLLGWTGSSRFQLKMGKSGDRIVVSGPGGASSGLFLELDRPLATDYFDGAWHRYRMHWRINDDGTGTLRQWIDEELVAESTGSINSTAENISFLKLGANRNHGMDEPMSLWFGPIRMWQRDPGW